MRQLPCIVTIAAQKQAEREKRTTIQRKDVGEAFLYKPGVNALISALTAVIIKRADEFFFLEGLSYISK